MRQKYSVERRQWVAHHPKGRTIIIDSGFRVVKQLPSPGRYQGIRMQFDPKVIASFDDDEKTARAVCRDLNRARR